MLFLARPAAAATSLRSLAEAKGIYFGTAVQQGNLSNSTLTGVATSQFDMVTPGNEMKWDTTEPSNGRYNFGPGDAIVSWAKRTTCASAATTSCGTASCPRGCRACR